MIRKFFKVGFLFLLLGISGAQGAAMMGEEGQVASNRIQLKHELETMGLMSDASSYQGFRRIYETMLMSRRESVLDSQALYALKGSNYLVKPTEVANGDMLAPRDYVQSSGESFDKACKDERYKKVVWAVASYYAGDVYNGRDIGPSYRRNAFPSFFAIVREYDALVGAEKLRRKSFEDKVLALYCTLDLCHRAEFKVCSSHLDQIVQALAGFSEDDFLKFCAGKLKRSAISQVTSVLGDYFIDLIKA